MSEVRICTILKLSEKLSCHTGGLLHQQSLLPVRFYCQFYCCVVFVCSLFMGKFFTKFGDIHENKLSQLQCLGTSRNILVNFVKIKS